MKCPVCKGKYLVFVKKENEKNICPFCRGYCELDWTEYIIGVDSAKPYSPPYKQFYQESYQESYEYEKI